MKCMKRILFLYLFTTISFANSDYNKVRELMIQKFIASYSGNCPCPYNTAKNGSSCGKRSAYSKAGGYTPYCYKTEIDDNAVKEFLKNNK